ncbi:MAG TPA: adenosylmethionine--8-amino-7-oxononanoate transaminase [Planctomycetota bacterium]|nr:adenosylmethionine--8-amino-7-oxononanoate transaminase [Planctomycetota bacterium]
MPDSEDIIRDDREHVWHPFTWMPGYLAEESLVITAAEGVFLVAADGTRYLDGISSMWLNVHGHARAEIAEAIATQAKAFAHVSLFGQTHAPAATLARRLVEIAPAGLTHVFYTDDGATAVEVALKLAFQSAQLRGETKRTRFVALEHAYHGDTIGAVSVGDIEHFHHAFRPLLFDCIRTPAPVGYPFHDEAAGSAARERALAALERIFETRADEVCAFILEPVVQGAAGMLIHPEGYLAGARKLCTKYGVPMIADEVFTGFGRTGRMFACEREGVSPDLLCLAKGLTGGTVPLAVTLATESIYNAFTGDDPARATFFHGHSYCANPVGCAAALASLDLFKKDGTLGNVARLEGLFIEAAACFRRLPGVTDSRCVGLVFAVDVTRAKEVCAAAKRRGLLIRPLGDVVYLVPPLVTSEDELTRMIRILYDALTEVNG